MLVDKRQPDLPKRCLELPSPGEPASGWFISGDRNPELSVSVCSTLLTGARSWPCDAWTSRSTASIAAGRAGM
ncbi:unnamed protein product [Merluccius merluccius]